MHAHVLSHTNQGDSLVLGLKSAFGTLSGAISHMSVTNLPPPSTVFSSSGAGTSTIREANGSPVANSSPPFDGFIVEDCSDDEELEEEQIDFTFFEEEDEGSLPSSSTPVTLELPASPKDANFNPSNTIKAGKPPFSPLLVVNGEIYSLSIEASHLAQSSCIFQS